MFSRRRIWPYRAMNSFCAASPMIGSPSGNFASSSLDPVGVLGVVVGVRLEQHDAACVLVAEQRDGVVGLFLQIAEGDDVAVGLDRVQDAVGARVRLDQAVVDEALVDEQRVERRGVEAGQEHVDHDDQVDLAVLQPLGQVLVVVLELVGAGVEARAEDGVVVLDRGVEEVSRGLVERARLEALLVEVVVADILVGGVGVDRSRS